MQTRTPTAATRRLQRTVSRLNHHTRQKMTSALELDDGNDQMFESAIRGPSSSYGDSLHSSSLDTAASASFEMVHRHDTLENHAHYRFVPDTSESTFFYPRPIALLSAEERCESLSLSPYPLLSSHPSHASRFNLSCSSLNPLTQQQRVCAPFML